MRDNNMTMCRYVLSCVLSAVLFVLVFVLGANPVQAQVETAKISGTASDPSSAALVGTTVQAKNVATNATQSNVEAPVAGARHGEDAGLRRWMCRGDRSSSSTALAHARFACTRWEITATRCNSF